MSRPGLAWRLAGRELRGGLKSFVVFLACLILGVAAIAAVGVISATVRASLERDAAALFGGDLKIDSTNMPVDEAELAALWPAGARRSDVVRTNAMAYGPDGRRVVVALKAVDDAYPLYGQTVLDPPSLDLAEALAAGGTAVERSLLARLGIALGDTIRIGAAEFEIRAVLERDPDQDGYIRYGPRAVIGLDQLPRTETILPGSIARYSYRFALPDGVDAETVAARISAEHPDSRWRVRSVRDIQPRIRRLTDRLGSYLTLAGLTALLIGGVGVALAVQNYLAGKTATIATLKCLGAPSGLVFRVYLLQVLTLAGCGIMVGLLLGQAASWGLSLLAQGLLPVDLATGFYPLPLSTAAACGLLTAVVFALWPLAQAREISPAAMFRSVVAPARRWPRTPVLALLGLSVAALAALAVLGVADRWLGLIFVAIVLVSAILLAALAWLLLHAVRRVSRRGGARLRMALANLHRPGAGAPSVIMALGAGLTVLTMVALLERNLAAEVQLRFPDRAPSVYFVDIQPGQIEPFKDLVAGVEGARLVQNVPVLRGRVVRIAGVPVAQTGLRHWSLGSDRGLSYAAAKPEGAQVVAGSWWPENYQGPPLVSVEDDVAEALGIGIGDTLAFNVLGRVIEAEIASLRAEIDWGEARLDFLFVFSPGVLEAAPHTYAAAVDLPAAREPELLDAAAAALPNVTPVSVRELVAQVGEMMRKIGFAVAAVGAVTLLSGLMVLAGAVAAARRRHLYESVVLKVLGARRADLLQVFLLEYLGLGSAAALAGAVLGTLGAFVIVTFVLDLPWTFSPAAVLAVAAMALVLTLSAGFAGTWRLLGRPAAPVLRTP